MLLFLFFLFTMVRSFSLVRSPQRRLSSPVLKNSLLTDDVSQFNLPPKLEEIVVALRKVTDDRLRYQQLLFMASKCQPFDPSLKVAENKVIGCLSTVHVHATLDSETKMISFIGDSDSQLTKGLLALLVNGLSGSSNEQIQAVKPEFIRFAGIDNSLTPGRNNGFLNMLRLMKAKSEALSSRAIIVKGNESNPPKSMYDTITTKLSMLKPTLLEVVDESFKHAGHAGVASSQSSETHFNVKVIAPCFQGLTLVQRHKMIYTLLANEMSTGIHALSIVAKTPEEPI